MLVWTKELSLCAVRLAWCTGRYRTRARGARLAREGNCAHQVFRCLSGASPAHPPMLFLRDEIVATDLTTTRPCWRIRRHQRWGISGAVRRPGLRFKKREVACHYLVWPPTSRPLPRWPTYRPLPTGLTRVLSHFGCPSQLLPPTHQPPTRNLQLQLAAHPARTAAEAACRSGGRTERRSSLNGEALARICWLVVLVIYLLRGEQV